MSCNSNDQLADSLNGESNCLKRQLILLQNDNFSLKVGITFKSSLFSVDFGALLGYDHPVGTSFG